MLFERGLAGENGVYLVGQRFLNTADLVETLLLQNFKIVQFTLD